jgi:YidC/Oxa1 family membrane protein insertase
MKSLFNTTLYEPLYNALIGLIDIIPGGDMGLAVILLTLIVKFILFPLSASSIRTQIKMKEIDGEVKNIKEEYKDNREEMGKKMLELYRKNKINPFAGIFLILIQLPIILALYFVFARAGFPDVNTDILYSFIPTPESINTSFLGFIDLASNKNILLALLAGVSQYFQMKFVMSNVKKRKDKEDKKESNPMEEVMEKMQFQMKFIMPIITFFISFTLVSVVGLYWFVSNVFAIGQELYIQKKIRNPLENQN